MGKNYYKEGSIAFKLYTNLALLCLVYFVLSTVVTDNALFIPSKNKNTVQKINAYLS